MTQVWVLSGMSGAGMHTALRALERRGVECVDNLPIALLDGFAALPRNTVTVAVVDARQRDALTGYEPVPGTRTLFLDAGDGVLVRRNADSTRPHPCADAGGGMASVRAERSLLEALRAAADVVIDTSDLDAAGLARQVVELVVPEAERPQAALVLTVSSFGFKHGPQTDADWVIDARLMPNPFWEPELRPLTGLDAQVRDFVLKQPEAREFVQHIRDVLRWALPHYLDHRRGFLHVAIGCTGGRHRSVVMAEELGRRMTDEKAWTVRVVHRDVARPDPRT